MRRRAGRQNQPVIGQDAAIIERHTVRIDIESGDIPPGQQRDPTVRKPARRAQREPVLVSIFSQKKGF